MFLELPLSYRKIWAAEYLQIKYFAPKRNIEKGNCAISSIINN